MFTMMMIYCSRLILNCLLPHFYPHFYSTTITLQLRVLICLQYVLDMSVFDSSVASCLAIWSL